MESPHKTKRVCLCTHLISSVGYSEGEVIGVRLLFTGMDILNFAGSQVSLGKRADPCSCNRIKRCETLQ